MQAYLNDSATKASLIGRLGARTADQWVAQSIFWNNGKGSLIGAAIEGDDLDQWVEKFGLPKWLALALDELFMASPSFDAGAKAGIEILAALEPGRDYDLTGHALIARCLSGAGETVDRLSPALPVRDIAASIAAMHSRAAQGEIVSATDWRAIRRKALAVGEGVDAEQPEALWALCAEAAGWSPVSSRTAVSDTLRYWRRALATTQSDGWGAEDDDCVRARLNQLHAAEKPNVEDPSKIDVFALLRQHDPELDARLLAHYAFEREQHIDAWHKHRNLLIEGLSAQPRLISRKDLFANPVQAGMRISPDGVWLAWVADTGGIMNVWAAPAANISDARQITFDRHRGVGSFSWTYQPGILLYSQDTDGDENWRIHAADVATATVRALTPSDKAVQAGIMAISRQVRDAILITMNARDPRYPDIYRLDLKTGECEMVQENPGVARFICDDTYAIRLAVRPTPAAGAEILRKTIDGEWETWISLDIEDVSLTGPSYFGADNRTLYFYDSRGRDTTALTAFDMETGVQTLIAQSNLADVGGTLNEPGTYRPLAYGVTYDRYKLHILDDGIRPDVEFLDSADIGEWNLSSRTEDNRLWLVSAGSDVRPAALYLYDRSGLTLKKLYDLRPELSDAPLSRMQPVAVSARDGLKLVSYLTLPPKADTGEDLKARWPVPLILVVHGGPWSRDGFGYNGFHQWLANRGYGVLSVNFRASAGFGKAFLRAGDGEWGGKMDEDLEDAVQWAIDAGIADPSRLGIFGGSYGGYAVLSALTRYPERYACGIDVVGPSNLETLLASIPPYWEAERALQYRAIGDPTTEEGSAFLKSRSPLYRAEQMKAPLLVAQGGNDPRVKQAEAEQMVEALRACNIPVSYALFPDEGHGFVREPNRMIFNALTEVFFARHLGGRMEPWQETDFPGNSLIMQDEDRNAVSLPARQSRLGPS